MIIALRLMLLRAPSLFRGCPGSWFRILGLHLSGLILFQ